jgi:hypothetical protein
MSVTTIVTNAAGAAGKVFSEGASAGGEPYILPALTGLILAILLVTILVLALAYNIRTYRPPEGIHHGEDSHGETHPERE